MTLSNCDRCKRPLIEINRYGEWLIGCVDCNRWVWPGGDDLFMELPEEDLRALQKLRKGEARNSAP